MVTFPELLGREVSYLTRILLMGRDVSPSKIPQEDPCSNRVTLDGFNNNSRDPYLFI